MQMFTASDSDASKRLDIFVHEQLPNLSRSFIEKLIESKRITAGQKPQKPSYKLKPGDKIQVDFDERELNNIAQIKLPILYEDDAVIVIDKPHGLLSHSKGTYNPEPTVATFIKSKIHGLEGERAGIVHRLDRATSGVMICAKTPTSLKWLQKQFASRKVSKVYLAVVNGKLNQRKAIIDMPIERDPANPKQFRVGSSGKPAVTQYEVLRSNEERSLLKLTPVTGRTHQLRVHLKQIGHPIIGDTLYGVSNTPRMLLHAYSLEITLPSKERKIFTSSVPVEITNMLQ